MHWVLQNNLFNEDAYKILLETLERFGLPHSIHKVIPFIGELTPEPSIDTKNVICMGSYSLRHSARKYGWNPGVFDLESYDFTVQMKHWKEHMLNHDAKVLPFQDVKIETRSFLRPIQDSKCFAGRVFDHFEFESWKPQVLNLETHIGGSLSKDTLVQVCPIKEIYTEYRFWVVKGKISSASQYKEGNRIIYRDSVPDMFHSFVKEMIGIWQPHDAFVIDVADTPEGIKIVEINTINASGFYACNIPKLVMDLEDGFSLQ